MAAEVAGMYCLQWPHLPFPPRSHFFPKTLPFSFSFSSYSSIAYLHRIGHQSPFLGTALFQFCNYGRRTRGRRRGPSPNPSLDGFVDDDEDEVRFEERIDELANEFKLETESRLDQDAETSNISNSPVFGWTCAPQFFLTPEIPAMPKDPWPTWNALPPEMVERRANCFDFPLLFRILQRKKKMWENAMKNDSASCPVRISFTSMVFIVDLLQSYTIGMRAPLFSSSEYQIQGILARVHDELHATFIWLFQYIFYATPSLMVYLMLLLANFTVFSITDHHAAGALPPRPISITVEESEAKALSNGRSSIVCVQSVAGASCEDGWDRSFPSLLNGGTNSSDMPSTAAAEKECIRAWKGILQEAELIQANDRHEALTDPDTLRRFVTPVEVELEPEDLSACSETELSYRRALAEDPDDPLILSNFAQFLFLVLRDHDGAEQYFKRAVKAAPADAEALCRYANFLWVARGDLEAAEETFLEAVAADPGNSHYSASYAHFLWSTGGDDTCYPLDVCDV